MTIDELNSKVQAIDIMSMVSELLEFNEKKIVEFNTEQLFAGFDSKNKRLTLEGRDDYRPFTKKYKTEKQQPIDRITLKDTGDFYKGFVIKDFEITSTDIKTPELISKSGVDIFGITPEDMATINDTILSPQLTIKVQNAIL